MKHPNDIKRPNSNSGSLGQMYRARAVMLHKSCDVAKLPDPANPAGPRIMSWKTPKGRGSTYNIGRNAAKRDRKAKAAA